ncbi:MAG: helix-turn-helix domain-containing protein [Chlamydiales bacterium]|nr:helix-turn-helix domain-containing protein [Chlamydiia bacterium]MCP5508659.1 helix-turn-helix domain-containing protein [Chlamydiales bacterium]
MSGQGSSVGQQFKQRRKERNLSLKEAENATSIRMSYLQAIEEGEMHKLISPVYALGFVKQYASYLGLDGDQLVREHPELFAKPQKQYFDYGIGTLEMRGNPGAGVKWLPNTVWVAVFFVMLIAAWFVARFLEVI